MPGYFKLLVIGASVAALSAVVTWLLIHASVPARLVAQPRKDRWHTAPIPTTGGIAILLSASVSIAALGASPYTQIVAAGLAIALLGLTDDLLQLKPAAKLFGQAVIAACVVAGGVVFPATHTFPLDSVLTWAWIVGMTNAFNLIDNMDGLCAGVTIIICSSRMWAALQSGDSQGATLGAVLAGAYLGFLVFNFHPARIFMGDCGSMFAGFMLASLAAASPAPHTKAFLSAILSPALAFLYPAFDTILVSVLRRAAGRPISVGGRDHSSHRLVSLGHSERTVVLILWALTGAGAAVGLATWWMPVGVHALAAILVAGVFVFGVFLGTLPTYPLPERAPVRLTAIRRWIPTLRAGIILILDVLLAGVALLTAFLVRWENAFAVRSTLTQFLTALPIVMGWQTFVSVVFRSARIGWRSFGVADLLGLAKCAVAATLASGLTLFLVNRSSVTIMLVYCVLLLTLSVGMRAFIHVLRESLTTAPVGRRVAILGSGQSSDFIAFALRACKVEGLSPVCVLDSDPASDHTRIQGTPVFYAGANPVGVIRRVSADVLVLPSTASSRSERHLIEACVAAGIPVQQLSLSITPWTATVEVSSTFDHRAEAETAPA